ncbi:unnamed protein product [Rhodiola kirilowii]
MKFEMEMRSSASYPNLINSSGYAVNHHHHHQSQRRQHRSSSSKWSPEENKMFENALAVYDKDSPDKWEKVAAMIPGKTVSDVMKQYEELEADVSSIEAGLVPVNPGYSSPVFTLDWVSGSNFDDGDGFSGAFGGKRLASVKAGSEQDQRKKGVPWTEEEHKLFLLGLKKYGKGDWRNISRNFVITRTPTQVASHAQKYFIRQHSGVKKDKRRASIHDITVVNLLNDPVVSPDDHVTKGQQQHSPEQPFGQWNLQHSNNSNNNGGSMEFNAACYGFDSGRGRLDIRGGNYGMLDSSSYMGFQM